MKPAEKAKKLVYEFYKLTLPKNNLERILVDENLAKESALICVNEIIGLGFLTNGTDHERIQESQVYYWKEVIKEIEKL